MIDIILIFYKKGYDIDRYKIKEGFYEHYLL